MEPDQILCAEELLSEGTLAIERSHRAEKGAPWQPGTCGRWEDLLQELTEWQLATAERSRAIFSLWGEKLIATIKEPDARREPVSPVLPRTG